MSTVSEYCKFHEPLRNLWGEFRVIKSIWEEVELKNAFVEPPKIKGSQIANLIQRMVKINAILVNMQQQPTYYFVKTDLSTLINLIPSLAQKSVSNWSSLPNRFESALSRMGTKLDIVFENNSRSAELQVLKANKAYVGTISDEETRKLLTGKAEGAFVIRETETGALFLSVRVGASAIFHYCFYYLDGLKSHLHIPLDSIDEVVAHFVAVDSKPFSVTCSLASIASVVLNNPGSFCVMRELKSKRAQSPTLYRNVNGQLVENAYSASLRGLTNGEPIVSVSDLVVSSYFHGPLSDQAVRLLLPNAGDFLCYREEARSNSIKMALRLTVTAENPVTDFKYFALEDKEVVVLKGARNPIPCLSSIFVQQVANNNLLLSQKKMADRKQIYGLEEEERKEHHGLTVNVNTSPDPTARTIDSPTLLSGASSSSTDSDRSPKFLVSPKRVSSPTKEK